MTNKMNKCRISRSVRIYVPSEARPTVKFGNYDRIRNFVVLLSLLNLQYYKNKWPQCQIL